MATVYKSKKEAVRLLMKDQGEFGNSPQEMKFTVDYLSFFGYLSLYLLNNLTLEDLKASIKNFQKFFGIKADGVAGPMTLKAMAYPRCGCPDVLDVEQADHRQYMQMQEMAHEKQQKWLKTELTYFVDGYVTGLSKKVQDACIAESFKAWSDVCGIHVKRFTARNKKNADILVGVGRGKDHGFDGQGGTLAWAYLPDGNKQLRMRFDLAEIWVKDQFARGVWMLPVATHEAGHILGLSHSKVKDALMAPYYNPFVSVPKTEDDIKRIQALYGPSREGLQMNSATRTIVVKPGEDLLITCE